MKRVFNKIKDKISRTLGRNNLICTEIFESLSILSDGSVTCGCFDIYEGRILGNIHEKSLEEIFHNEKYRELRRRMISGDLPPQCQNCPVRIRTRTGKESLEPGPITWLQIDPIFNCNLRCPACAFTEMRDKNYFIRPRTALSLEIYNKIIDQAAPTLKHIRFHMLGEPFLNKNAGRMLQYSKEKIPNIFISIETNGAFVDPDMQKLLVENRIDYVKFSIDGASQETYEKYRVGGIFQEVYENMASLVRMKKSMGAHRPKIIWQYILFEWNDSDGEIRKAQNLAQKADVDELYWLLTHSVGASKKFLPFGKYPVLEGNKQSVNMTIEIACKKGEPLPRPPLTLEEYDPWK